MLYVRYFCGLLVVAVLCVQNGGAIRCYECNSVLEPNCIGNQENPLTENLKKECPEKKGDKPYTLCRKIRQFIDFEVNGLKPDTRTIRTCGYEDSQYANRCYQRSGFGGRQEVCACQTDDCNASSLIMSSATLTVGLLLLLKYCSA
ncbi:uncharacterized protein LOC132699699 [Cylas formicarius]|uniref:uncharacterized protein LOC132699699 n=1 Tax=Cylas formicarius TaxID=197179 RepID=UPI002958DE09|nr:uncharacterized protein LOC132699699 [Cylas formicarius]